MEGAEENIKKKMKGKIRQEQVKGDEAEGLTYQKIEGFADISGQTYELKMASQLLRRGVNLTDGFYLGSDETGAGDMTSSARFKKLGGAAGLSGQKYEYKMTSLMYLRGVNHTDAFHMGTNVLGAGAFDDVVFKYKLKGEDEFRTCFIQLKHKSPKNRISFQNLVEAKGDFSLCKYFESYQVVAKAVTDRKGVLFDVPFSNCDFILYSNAKVDNLLRERVRGGLEERDRVLFGTREDGRMFCLSSDVDADVYSHPNLVEKGEGIKEFLPRLQLFAAQASEDHLDYLIEQEIKTALHTNVDDSKKIAQMFIEKMQLWWEETGESDVLTESAQLWRDVVASRLDLMNDSKMKEMEALNISFTDQEIDSFNQSLSSSLVINVMSPHAKLTSVKISQVLEKHHSKRYIFLDQTSLMSWKPEVLRAWQSVWCDVLVIECSTDAGSLTDELSKVLPDKKLILLSESGLPGYQQILDNFSWNQLESSSQQLVLEKDVDFHGHNVSLESVVGEHCTHALSGGVVTEVLSPVTKLTFGKKIPDNISYYIPRSLERSDYINKEAFDPKLQEDYFIISNVEEQDVTSLEESYCVRLNGFDENQDAVPHHFYWTDGSFTADNFKRFCQKIPGQNVHWLSVDQSNLVYWKQSFNNMDVIKQNIDKSKKRTITAEYLKDMNERVVLVSAEPGMGKTTYLNNVAQSAKIEEKSMLVIRVYLNGITRSLQEHTEQYFTNHENVTDFLIEVMRNCELDNEILRSRLTRTGNVRIYIDGFDEISPYYNDKVTNMIKSMMKLKVGQIWLTSRNVMRHHLESELQSICYSMKPFTDEDQISFLVKLWNAKYLIQINDTSREFSQNLLVKASESFSDRDREFTGIPLQCMMLGEVFAGNVKKGVLNLPNRLDLLHLFEKFISEKLNILIEDKDQIEASNPRQIAKREREQKMMMESHSNAAILLILSAVEIDMLKVINKNSILLNVDKSFSGGGEWTGLIDGMADGKPSFIHRCFAEYFLAWWLSENILSSTDFIAQHLFEPRFVTVRQFFDRLLSRDCPLHNAVLSADREQVEALLTSGADVNRLDKGGRSALHLSASYPDNDSVTGFGFDITSEASIMQLLITHGADNSLKDRILQGTPLRYADKSKLWGKVEYFLKKGANTDGLIEMRELVNSMIERYCDTENTTFKAIHTCYLIVKHGCFHILQFAVDECKFEVSKYLMSSSGERITLLHAAAESGCEDSVKFLLERGADIMERDKYAKLPIHVAAESGHLNIILLLSASGIDVKGNWGTPLTYAAGNGRLDIVKWLVDAGANLNHKTRNDDTPLLLAVKNEHLEVAKYLIHAGADVNVKNLLTSAPLTLAAQSGQLDIVKCLVEAGAEVNAKTDNDDTPLLLAVKNKHVEVAQWLIENGAIVNVKNKGKSTPLTLAAASGLLDIIKMLVKAGAYLNAKTKNDYTPLILAMYDKHLEVAKCLIHAGAEVNVKKRGNGTPLTLAATSGQLDIVKLLVDAGADLNAKNDNDDTPLTLAVRNKHVEVAKCLIENGADTNVRDSESWSQLTLAAASGQFDIVKCLVDAGADLNAKTNNDDTPLILAVWNKHLEVAKYLIHAGADVNLKTKCNSFPLTLAAEHGQLDIVKLLEDAGADLNAKTNNDNTPLILAVWNKHLEVAKCLIHAGADVNVKKRGNDTPLTLAADSGQLDIVKLLVDAGADLNAKNDNSGSPLLLAVCKKHLEVAKYLIHAGADVNLKTKCNSFPLTLAAEHGQLDIVKLLEDAGADLNVKTDDDDTPLLLAVYYKHEDVAKFLIHAGADVNLKNKGNSTPLTVAAEHGQLDIVKLLEDAGADLNAKTNNDNTPLILAVWNKHLEVAKCLIHAGADVNVKKRGNDTPLTLAADSGQLDIVKLLVDAGADLNAKNDNSGSPLLLAVCKKHLEVAKYLIHAGADVNLKTKCNSFPLTLAAEHGQLDIVKLLEDAGADLNVKTDDDDTPLLLAVYYKHEDVAKFLIHAGADVNLKNKGNSTPLTVAAEHGQLDIVKLLVEAGADLNVKTDDDDTPLLLAVYDKHEDVAKFLIHAGADVNLKNKGNSTPLTVAAEHGQLDIVKLLVEAGADLNAKADNSVSPLLFAVKNKHVEVAKCLIENGADVNVWIGDFNPLIIAVLFGLQDIVKLLVNAGFELNAKTYNSVSPLLLAVQIRDLYVAKFLIEAGADVNVNDIANNTPLTLAAASGKLDVVKSLVGAGAEVNAKTKKHNTSLLLAVRNKHVAVAKCLIENGADANVKNSDSWSPLALAAASGQLDIVKLLVEAGADLNANTMNDDTPLLLAVWKKHLEVAKCLIEAGADVNVNNRGNFIPLTFAAALGQLDVVKLLVEAGADLNAKTTNDDTPLILALQNKHLEVAKCLIEAGADVNTKECTNIGPLHFAAGLGQLDIVKLLVEAGAEINAKTNDFHSPLLIAVLNRHVDVAKCLIDAGANVNVKDMAKFSSLHHEAEHGQLDIVRWLVEAGADLNAKTDNGETPLLLAVQNKHEEVAKSLIEAGDNQHCTDIHGLTL